MADSAKFRDIPSQSELLDFLSYDPETGLITYTKPRGRADVGTVTNGPRIGIKGIKYEIGRIIWMLVTGNDPIVIVDHHDGDHSNNRWHNLRLATRQQNTINSKIRNSNLTGFKGVEAIHNKSGTVYRVRIGIGGKSYCLGKFSTPEEAAAAYNAAAENLHGEFSVTRRPSRPSPRTSAPPPFA